MLGHRAKCSSQFSSNPAAGPGEADSLTTRFIDEETELCREDKYLTQSQRFTPWSPEPFAPNFILSPFSNQRRLCVGRQGCSAPLEVCRAWDENVEAWDQERHLGTRFFKVWWFESWEKIKSMQFGQKSKISVGREQCILRGSLRDKSSFLLLSEYPTTNQGKDVMAWRILMDRKNLRKWSGNLQLDGAWLATFTIPCFPVHTNPYFTVVVSFSESYFFGQNLTV